MYKVRAIATLAVLMGVWVLSTPLEAEQANYGHCRDEQHEFTGHSFYSGPTGTVCRTCEGADGGGCHLSFYSFYTCGPDMPAGHGGCPGHPY